MGLYPPSPLPSIAFPSGIQGLHQSDMGIDHNSTILCICYSISVIDNQLCYILYPSIGCPSLAVVTVVTLGFQHYNGCMLVHVHALIGFFIRVGTG